LRHKARPLKGKQFVAGKPHPRRKRRQVVPSKEGTFSRAEVLAAAEKGVEAEELAVTLGLTGRLQADPELRRVFEETVALGNARMKTAVARRIYDEGVGKGKASILIEAAKRWLERYGEDVLTVEEVQGTVQRALEFVKQFKQRETENAS
jgi:hypothetical protein